VSDDGSSDPTPSIRRIASQLLMTADSTSGGLVDALLHGGTVPIYRCSDASIDDTSCMSVGTAPENLTVATSEAIVPQVQSLLSSIAEKIQTDTPLTAQELGLI